ncbi:MAG: kinase, partial [Verrucomicrobiota bacterium]
LHALNGMVDQAVKLLSSRDDLTAFGKLLHEAWLIKRSFSAQVTNSDVDGIYEAARAAGALGGKLTGAGGGGFMLLFAPPERQAAIRERLSHLLLVPFQFDTGGSQIIFYAPGEDYSTAECDRANRSIQAFCELESKKLA